MKRIITILLLLNVVLFGWQCRKNSTVVNPTFSTDCYTGTFTQTNIPTTQNIIDAVTFPDNSVAVLTQESNTGFLYFYDSHGRYMSQKTFTQPNSSTMMNMLATSDGDLVISSASTIFLDSTITVPSKYYLSDSNYNVCNTTSGLLYTYTHFITRLNQSTAYLTKMDKEGNVKWVKSFPGNYYTGSSLAYSGSNILFLTTKNDMSRTLDTATTPGGYDTIKSHYLYSNILYLYSVDILGNISWNKEFDNIAGYYCTVNLYNFQSNIKANANNILLQSGFNVLMLNAAGNLLSKQNFQNEYCNSYYNNNPSFALNIALGATQYFVNINTQSSSNTSTVYAYNLNQQYMYAFTLPYTYSGYTRLFTDANGNIIFNSNGTLAKYDPYGNLILSPAFSGKVLTFTCDQGMLLFGNYSRTSGLIKMDAYGNL